MTDLKKIADDIRHHAEWCDPVKIEWADTLDALAAQGPVAWRWKMANGKFTAWIDLPFPKGPPLDVTIEYAYAAPQPVTVSREALLEAFMIYADPQMVRVTYSVEKLRALGIEVKE